MVAPADAVVGWARRNSRVLARATPNLLDRVLALLDAKQAELDTAEAALAVATSAPAPIDAATLTPEALRARPRPPPARGLRGGRPRSPRDLAAPARRARARRSPHGERNPTAIPA